MKSTGKKQTDTMIWYKNIIPLTRKSLKYLKKKKTKTITNMPGLCKKN